MLNSLNPIYLPLRISVGGSFPLVGASLPSDLNTVFFMCLHCEYSKAYILRFPYSITDNYVKAKGDISTNSEKIWKQYRDNTPRRNGLSLQTEDRGCYQTGIPWKGKKIDSKELMI